MKNVLVISNMTTTRALVIAQRTGSDFIAGAKSIMIENLKEKLQNGIAHFIFLKKDGSLRESWGTTNRGLVEKNITGTGVCRENFNTTAYFDVELGGWRSFRWESIIKVF